MSAVISLGSGLTTASGCKISWLRRAHAFLCMNQCSLWHSRSQYCTTLHFEHFFEGFSSPHVLHVGMLSTKPLWPFIADTTTLIAEGGSFPAKLVTICLNIVHSLKGKLRTASLKKASIKSKLPSFPVFSNLRVKSSIISDFLSFASSFLLFFLEFGNLRGHRSQIVKFKRHNLIRFSSPLHLSFAH